MLFYLERENDYLLTAFFNSAPALNLATVLAAILIALPVCGFLPALAADKQPFC